VPSTTNSSPASNWALIVLAARDRIASALSLPANKVFIRGTQPRGTQTPGEFSVHLRTLSTDPIGGPGQRIGGRQRVRRLAVDLFTRSGKDSAGDDRIALTESVKGHYYREEAAVLALDLWRPSGALVPFSEVAPVAEPFRDNPELGFIVSTLYFEITYLISASCPVS
jgi:hypothetical protein